MTEWIAKFMERGVHGYLELNYDGRRENKATEHTRIVYKDIASTHIYIYMCINKSGIT